MNFNASKLGEFVKRKANDKLAKATGINLMSEYRQAHYKANAMGFTYNGKNTTKPTNDTSFNFGGSSSAPTSAQLNEEHPLALVTTVEEFLAQRDSLALTPHGGVVMFLHALLNYSQPASCQAGLQMLVLCMWEENLVQGDMYKGYSLNPQDMQRLAAVQPPNDYVVRSFVAGIVPEHGYSLQPQQVGVRFQPLQAELPPAATEAQLLLWSSGADAPRPVIVRRNTKGFWKVVDFTALLETVRPPSAPVHSAADDL